MNVSSTEDRTSISFVPSIGRRARVDSWEEQKVSTYRKVREAIADERWDEAARLMNYFVDEGRVCFSIYRQWIPDLNAFLRENGVDPDELERVNEEIVAKLALPDGTPWNAYEQWNHFLTSVEATVRAIHRERKEEALELCDVAKETWRRGHDRDVDHTYGLMSEIVARCGESSIGPMWDKVIVPLFSWRYDKFDIDKNSWDEALYTLMLVACEAMRGHLVGPERTGDFELIETDDRFILRFDPCGSGGRTLSGDAIEGTPSRMEAPYDWTVSQEPHPWNHGEKGICHYCTHCIRLMEEMAIDRFGYPVRVVDPPHYGQRDASGSLEKCQWQMFKDPTNVPEEYYARVGRVKPEAFGSAAHGATELPPVTGMPGAG